MVRAGVAHVVHDVGHDPAVASFGQEATDALGVEPGRVFKTLVASADGQLVVAVVPVSGELSLKALAAAVGAKTAGMAEAAMAERATGYVVGGVGPISARKRRLPTLVESRHSSLGAESFSPRVGGAWSLRSPPRTSSASPTGGGRR